MAGSQSTNRTRAQKRSSTILGSLQALPLGSAIREAIQKTTRASQVKPMTTQRNEPDSVEKKRGSHLKIPRNVGRTRTSDLSPTGIQFAHVNATVYEASANTWSLSDGPRPGQRQTAASTLTLSLPPGLSQTTLSTDCPQIDPASLNDSPLGRWIIRRATGQRARHITPKCPTTGTKLSQSEMKLRILPAQDKATFKQVCRLFIMKPSRREGPSDCERSQCNIARYSIHTTYKLAEVRANSRPTAS